MDLKNATYPLYLRYLCLIFRSSIALDEDFSKYVTYATTKLYILNSSQKNLASLREKILLVGYIYWYVYICSVPNLCYVLLFWFISLISVYKKCYSCHQLSTDLQRYYWKSSELGSCMSLLCTNNQHTCTKYNVSFYCYYEYMCIKDFFRYENYFCMSCWLY